MLYTKLTWSMTALVVCFHMIVATATVSILTFHPDLIGNFEEETAQSTPIEVTYETVRDVDAVNWDLQDYPLVQEQA